MFVMFLMGSEKNRQVTCDSTHEFKDVKIVIFLSPLKEIYLFFLRRKASSVQEESELA